MSDSNSRATATASVPGFVRNLGAFEEIYWLYNQLGAHGFAYAMEVDGPTIVAEWRSALDAIQRSHPFFSVCIEPNNGGVPFFRHVDGAARRRWNVRPELAGRDGAGDLHPFCRRRSAAPAGYLDS